MIRRAEGQKVFCILEVGLSDPVLNMLCTAAFETLKFKTF